MKIGIYGNGKIGNATMLLCENSEDIKTYRYDIDERRCCPNTTTLKEIVDCDMIFICLPTPMKFNGVCHTDLVDEAVSLLKAENCQAHLVIRSTVVPGTSKRLGCHIMPYFTTELGWEVETRQTERWLIGVNPDLETADSFQKAITRLLNKAQSGGAISHSTTEFLRTEEAEIVKYTRNAFLATKVSFFNEIKGYCDRLGVDYGNIRRVVTQDPRIGESHSEVPGLDGKPGFGGKSLMKDMMALCIAMESVGNAPLVLRPVLGRNARKDRPNENWNRPMKTFTITKEALDKQTISQLKSMCEQMKINTDNCVEKGELSEKIIDHEKELEQKKVERERMMETPAPAPAKGRQGHMFSQVQSSFQDQLNTIRARQSQMPAQQGQMSAQQQQRQMSAQQQQRQMSAQQQQMPVQPGQMPWQQQQMPAQQGQFPHQFVFGNYGNSQPAAGGGPVQMNIQQPKPAQSVVQTQHPGSMSVQNGGTSRMSHQNNNNGNQPQIGFNGGVQSTF